MLDEPQCAVEEVSGEIIIRWECTNCYTENFNDTSCEGEQVHCVCCNNEFQLLME